METIEIKDNKGKLLYSYTCENNSISKTLKQASIERIRLDNANLSGKLIENVALSELSLIQANFAYSTFNNVIITNTHLAEANLLIPKLKIHHFLILNVIILIL